MEKNYQLVPNYFHLCSKGTELDLLFHNRKEFVSGMNMIAFAVDAVQVEMLAFCIMDNHFHFILYAPEERVEAFARKLSQSYYNRRKRFEERGCGENLSWSAFLLDEPQYLMNAIAYVLRNPQHAGFQKLGIDYPWSTEFLYFRNSGVLERQLAGFCMIKDMDTRTYRSQLHTRNRLPDEWLVTEDGYVWPGSYVNWRKVESIYQNFSQYRYYMISRVERRLGEFNMEKYRIGISDHEVRMEAGKMAEELFGSMKMGELDFEQKLVIYRKLVEKWKCSGKQVCRILHLEYNPV